MRAIARLWWLTMLLIAAAAQAQDAGRVSFVSGEAFVERAGARVTLAHDSAVRQGDLVRTGADGNVQLVMVDGARVAMRPGTQLRIEQYEFRAEGDPGRALLNLVNGTLRVFTGALVSRDRERFQMKTNLATVGIRGSGNILVNLDGTETFNHTLTGAHSVTSIDAAGVARTLVSRPGQTVQVLPRQAPRYVPTPPMVTAAAAPPATQRAASSDKASDTPPPSSSSSTASTPSSSGSPSGTSDTSSSSSATAAAAPSSSEPAAPTTSTTTASTTTTTATTPATAPSEPAPVATTTTSPTTSTSTTTTTNPSVIASQATTGSVGSSIATGQPPGQGANYSVVFRFFNPIATGFEGVLGQDGGASSTAVLDNGGRLVSITGGSIATFLAGPGAAPPGFDVTTLNGDITFAGGTHRDAFRSSDNSVILGRWEGGTVTIADPSGARTFDLGPRSLSYQVVTPTPVGVVGSFTGTASYSLAGFTAPTDSAGHLGTVSSAAIAANFSAHLLNGTMALGINGQAFSISGVANLGPGASDFAFATALQNLFIACNGANCSSAGYQATVNGQFAGAEGRSIALTYRLNPNRTPGSGFSDFIIGSMALESPTAPLVGIVLPRTGSANLVFTGVDPNLSFGTYPGASGPPTLTGTVSANFTSQTASMNATVSGGCGCTNPTFTASATNMPIVGAGFSASTDTSRPPNVGAMTVACTGSGCGSSGSAAGRFDGLFRNSAGTTGIASISVGDSAGGYDVVASFGPAAPAVALPAADARAAARWIAPPESIPNFIAGMQRVAGSRTARIQ